jgi:hypothetical protein
LGALLLSEYTDLVVTVGIIKAKVIAISKVIIVFFGFEKVIIFVIFYALPPTTIS